MSLRAKQSNPDAKAKSACEFVIVIAGKEQTLVNEKCSEIIDRLIPPEQRPTGLLVADGDKITISEVLDEVRTLPFLTKKRVVVLRNAEKLLVEHDDEEAEKKKRDQQDKYKKFASPTNREILEKYFDGPCPTGVLVMTVSSWPGSTKLAKKLPKIGTLITVEPPKGQELRRQLTAYAQDVHNKRLDYGTADLLVDIAGDDITRLKTEIDKLAAYAGDDKAITAAHVKALVGFNRMFSAFAVIDACLERKPADAVERLRKMFAEDKNADYTTVGAFAFHFRRLFNVKKLLQEGLNEYQVKQKLWLGYNADVQFAQLRRLTIRQIGDYIKQLAEIDFAIKRGQAQPRIAIEQLVLRMAAL